jgi:hypothetical protein
MEFLLLYNYPIRRVLGNNSRFPARIPLPTLKTRLHRARLAFMAALRQAAPLEGEVDERLRARLRAMKRR